MSRGGVVKEANSLEEHQPGLRRIGRGSVVSKAGQVRGGLGRGSTFGHVFLYLFLSHCDVNVLILSPTIILYLGNNFAVSWIF